MSKRSGETPSPKTNSVIALASSVLPVPVGPTKSRTPRGRRLLERACAPDSPTTDRFNTSSAFVTAAGCPRTRLDTTWSFSASLTASQR